MKIKRSGLVVPTILIAIVALSLFVYANSSATSALVFHGYTLDRPNKKLSLPSELKEISGLALWQKDHVAMIQDEDGKVYIYDLSKEKVIDEVKFEKDGDYEAVACTDDKIYVVRSDGDIYKVKDLKGDKTDSKKYETLLSSDNDIEGACYDPKKNRLLLACKGDPGKGYGSEKDGIRSIWAFDLNTEQLIQEPLFLIYEDTIDALLDKKYGEHATRKFAPSAIEVEPASGNLWILASQGNLLIITTMSGHLIDAVRLPSGLYAQPEGLSFGPNGELLISNEAQEGKADLLVFYQGGAPSKDSKEDD